MVGKMTCRQSATARAADASFSRPSAISGVPHPPTWLATKGNSMKSKSDEVWAKPANAPTVRGR